MSRKHLHLATLLVATLFACSAKDDPSGVPAGIAGAAMQGSGGATAGAPTAGAPAAGAPAAGAPAAGSAGAVIVAGASSGGNSGGSSAGAPGGGAGGGGQSAAGAGGSSGGSTGMATKSAGCSKNSPRPANGKVSVANEEIIDFPASYDGTKPFPLLIALHACGNANTQWEGLTKGTAFETEYVRLMPNTTDSGQCWNQGSDTANRARIVKQYDDVLANYCIDTSNVYGVGHSSGAQMLVRVLAQKADAQHLNFKGVAPFAADPANVAIVIPVLYVDGIGDTQRGANSAKDTVAKFRTANMCSDTSKPYTPIMGCMSGSTTVNPGCIIYDNCKAPTIWCAHNDPAYLQGGVPTYHGVPCFGVKAASDFFKTL